MYLLLIRILLEQRRVHTVRYWLSLVLISDCLHTMYYPWILSRQRSLQIMQFWLLDLHFCWMFEVSDLQLLACC